MEWSPCTRNWNWPNTRPDEGGGVHDEHLVVRVDVHRLDKVRVREVGQEVEDVLQLVGDLLVEGELAVDDLLQVLSHLLELDAEALQAQQLVGDPLRERAHRRVLDVPQQVLHAHLGMAKMSR